ncbi:MAG TPA: hypothetical protein VMM58_02300 [Bacteroidota bacterium]|nr:hypothetical protein [Bacteroidota bacterium]
MNEERRHTHRVADAPAPGKEYQCSMNGTPLYNARIQNVMGCWATVEVVRPLPGPYQDQYKTGQRFDIRVSSYTFHEEA